MKIVPFLKEHAEAAQALALQNYNEERESVPILPAFEAVSALDEFAENGIGVSRQCRILNPLSKARDQTLNLMVPSRIRERINPKRRKRNVDVMISNLIN